MLHSQSSADAERGRAIVRERQELVRGGRFSRMHWIVLLLSLSLTLLASFVTKHEVDARSEASFTRQTDRDLALLSEQLRHYEGALWGGVAAIQANGGSMTDEQWKVYAETLDIVDKYPGANGIGVIYSVSPDDVDEFVANERITRPDFAIHPIHDQPELLPITSIEPAATNRAAIGLDMAHESNRFNGIAMARTTGLAWMTGPIVLVQDEGKTPGFLFFAPWYDQSRSEPSVNRADDFVGAVYAPFVVEDLVAGALANSQSAVAVTITDRGETLFDQNRPELEGYDPDPMFERQTDLLFYGRRWEVTTTSTLEFRSATANSEPLIILFGGLIIDALLVTLFLSLARSKRRAVRFADELTHEFVRNTERIQQSNSELERFAYVASHDLKTPLRGIGSLTEWIEEDLDELFKNGQAPPEVKSNLDRLKHQMNRMNSLIDGLLEYSRVGYVEEQGRHSADIDGFLRDLRLDLALSDAQLQLTGQPTVETTSACLLSQVITNLVTNAVHHHPDRKVLAVLVESRVNDDTLVLSVSDNGIGIEARHHDRIFEVFQTLGGGSTGIGLSVVRKIIDRQGGSIRIESELGEGTTFIVDWPLTSPTSQRDTTDAPSELRTEPKKLEMSTQ